LATQLEINTYLIIYDSFDSINYGFNKKSGNCYSSDRIKESKP